MVVIHPRVSLAKGPIPDLNNVSQRSLIGDVITAQDPLKGHVCPNLSLHQIMLERLVTRNTYRPLLRRVDLPRRPAVQTSPQRSLLMS